MSSVLLSRAGLVAALFALCAATGGPLLAEDKDKEKVVKIRIFTPRIVVKEVDKVKEVAAALEKLPSVKILPHSDATPHFLIEFDTSKVDLGDLAKAIASVETAAVKDETAAFLYLPVELKKEEQATLLKALANVKGVDAKKSEFPGGLPRIALDNKGGAKLSEVEAAIKSAVPKK